VILFAGLLLAPAAPGEEPPSEHVRKLIEGYRHGAVRVNGALLRITADEKGERDPAAPFDLGPSVAVHWSIDYDGPRPPLTILKPTLGPAGYDQTLLLFFLIADDGKDYPVPIPASPPNIPGIFFTGAADFATVKEKEVARGTLSISWQRVLAAAREKWPARFAESGPRSAYVQLRHAPTDRAEHLRLDAWTGRLQTELVPVPLKALGLE
jgi:hypothetical protein